MIRQSTGQRSWAQMSQTGLMSNNWQWQEVSQALLQTNVRCKALLNTLFHLDVSASLFGCSILSLIEAFKFCQVSDYASREHINSCKNPRNDIMCTLNIKCISERWQDEAPGSACFCSVPWHSPCYAHRLGANVTLPCRLQRTGGRVPSWNQQICRGCKYSSLTVSQMVY